MATHIQIEIHEYLSTHTEVQQHIGSKIAPLKADQRWRNAPPYVIYQKTSTVRHVAVDQYTGLAEASFTFNCYGATYKQANDVHEVIRMALAGLRDMTFGRGDTIKLSGAFIETEFDDWEEPRDGSQDGMFVVRQDWTFKYTEPVPTL